MPRQLRDIQPGDLLHLYNRGARGQIIFGDDDDRRLFIALLVIYSRRHGVEVVAYCLMGNHYHLVVRCVDDAASVSKMMRDFTSSYVQQFNEKYGYSGGLCMGRFCSKRVESRYYLKYLSAYVHFNPRHIGWTGDLATYPWSSYRHFLSPAGRPGWLHPGHVLQHFEDDDAYRRFVERHDPFHLPSDLDPTRLWRRFHDIDPSAVLEVVASQAGLDAKAIPQPRRMAERTARGLCAVLLVDHFHVEPTEAGPHLGLHTEQAVRSLLWRARRSIERDPESRLMLDACIRRLDEEPLTSLESSPPSAP